MAAYSLPKLKSVYVAESVRSGSIFDTQEKSGLAHYMEHIICEGIPSYPTVEQLSEYIESLAGSFNASTGSMIVRFHLNAPAIHLESLIKISSEVFFEPLFLESAIEKERGAILSEISQRKDQSWYKKSLFWSEVRYRKGHPLILDGGGSTEAVKLIQKEDIVNFWSRFFYPKNTYIVVVGNFNHKRLKALLEKYYLKYNSKEEFSGYPSLSDKDMSDRTVAIRHDPELQICSVDLAFPSAGLNVPFVENVNNGVINSIMANLGNSRLFKLLRQKLGLVYSIGMGTSAHMGFGNGYISFQVSLENLDQVLEIVIKELSAFISNGPTKQEVEFAKNYHMNSVLMRFDHPSNIAGWIEGDLLWEDKMYSPEETVEIYKKVTKESIQAFMKKYWDFSKLNLVIQGPIENSKENIKKYTEMIAPIK